MNRGQVLKCLSSFSRIYNAKACKLCTSNKLQKNVKNMSVFDRYVIFLRENKLAMKLERDKEKNEAETGKQTNKCELSVNSDIEPKEDLQEPPRKREEKLDKTAKNTKNATQSTNIPEKSYVEDSDPTKKGGSKWSDDESEMLRKKMTENGKIVPEDSSDIVEKINSKSSAECFPEKSANIDNIKTGSSMLGSQMSEELHKVSKSYKKPSKVLTLDSQHRIKNVDAANPINFVLNCGLIPDMKELSSSEGYSLFHQEIAKTGISAIPSVTKVLKKTMDPKSMEAIKKWERKEIERLGEKGFEKLRNDTFERGRYFHECIYKTLMGKTNIEITRNIEGYWKSISHVLNFIQLEHVKALEQDVTHPLLYYRGSFDCIALFRNTLCVIDWKTSNKPKPFISNTYENPLQLAAYLGAINSCYDSELQRITPVTNAVLVIAYPWGQPAHVHYLNDILCGRYWAQWLEKLHEYWTLVKKEYEEGLSEAVKN